MVLSFVFVVHLDLIDLDANTQICDERFVTLDYSRSVRDQVNLVAVIFFLENFPRLMSNVLFQR
jgi:hypothetical protein